MFKLFISNLTAPFRKEQASVSFCRKYLSNFCNVNRISKITDKLVTDNNSDRVVIHCLNILGLIKSEEAKIVAQELNDIVALNINGIDCYILFSQYMAYLDGTVSEYQCTTVSSDTWLQELFNDPCFTYEAEQYLRYA